MLEVKKFVFSPVEENTYLLYNESGDCLIIDPGCYFANERNELKDFIDELSLQTKSLLLTCMRTRKKCWTSLRLPVYDGTFPLMDTRAICIT